MIRNRFLFIILLLFFSCLRLGLHSYSNNESSLSNESSNLLNQRNLLNIKNTTDEITSDYYQEEDEGDTEDTEDTEAEQSATCPSRFDTTVGVVLFTAGVLYCFVGLAVICEGEFKDSVVELANFLKLPPDVAGATLMAAGTSSPELFTSLVALIGPVADIGTGTVVGSAIFNLLIIIGGCVLFSSHIFHLQWKPVLRDTLVNLFCFLFLYITFYDQLIHWYEAFLGCFFYVSYVAMMGVNTHIMNAMDKIANFLVSKVPCLKILQDPSGTKEEPSNIDELNEFIDKNGGGDDLDIDIELNDIELDSGMLLDDGDKLGDNSLLTDFDNDTDDNDKSDEPRKSIQEDTGFDVPEEKHEHFPTSIIGWVWYVLAWPYEIAFYYTVPPVKGRYKYQFLASFFLSLAWLGVFSTFMVKWTEKIGCILGISDAIMGVTFLAIGTSMPDCLTSIFVARTGRGNMAVCNALGSNIFDILLALCLPWALSTIISGTPVDVVSDTLVQDVLILTGTMGVIFISLCITRWRLNKKLGFLYYTLYIVFVTYTVIRELFF